MNDSTSTNSKCGIQLVEKIPGNLILTSEIDLKVKSYAGYASANGNNLFCWFFESQKCVGHDNPGDFPLLIWLNGGPGASSMAGLLLENGPYLQQSDDTGTLVENPYSWNKEVHIMYWDNPVGAGYSYNDDDYCVKSEDELSDQFHAALEVFFDSYPVYRSCPLYITGESYGGKYIPAIAAKIMLKNKEYKKKGKDDRIIKLKGLAIGNPWMDAALQTKLRLEMGFELGFLDTNQYNTLIKQYKPLPKLIEDHKWQKAFDLNQKLKKELVACAGNIAIYDVRTWDDGVFGSMLGNYFRLPAVKDALHVPEDQPWRDHDETGPVTEFLIRDFVSNTADCPDRHRQPKEFTFCLPDLLDAMDEAGKPELRVLLYTGNLDMSCGIRGTEQILYNLNWRNKDEWQALHREVWAEPRGNTLGYIKSYENLTQIVIPCSGHMVPSYQPESSLEMINNFVFQRPFPSYQPLPQTPED